MAITRENFLELEGHISQIFDNEMKKKKDYRPMMFNMETSNRSVEEHLGMGAVGKMQEWNGSVNYDSFDKGYQTDYRHAKYSNGLQIERELLQFGNFKEIKARTRKLALSAHKTNQFYGAYDFNYAFDSGTTGSDDVSLCSASHPYSPSDSTTQSNTGTAALTPANLEIAQNNMAAYTDDRGDILGMMGNLIIVGNYYRKRAKEIVGSELEPYNAENQINIYKEDGLNYLYNPYITGKKWFLVDKDAMMAQHNWYTARTPKIEYENDFDTEVGKYKLVGMWSYGWDGWSWVYGNQVS